MKQQHKHKDSDFDLYQDAYHEIDEAFPKFWKWAGLGLLVILFLFALPYLLGHTAKTLNACKDLKASVKNLKS